MCSQVQIKARRYDRKGQANRESRSAMEAWRLVAGVDEAGRGPLAGPVVAACVILPPHHPVKGIKDSKQLSEAVREQLYEAIRREAVACTVGIATPREIEQLNILRASLLAMRRAVEQLPLLPEVLLVDGRHAIPACPLRQQPIIDGDAQEECIAAASIVAKVVRDRLMQEYDRLYPGYGFAQHKGYATPFHLHQLQRLGPSPIHRRTFEPIARLIEF
ncbi:MAG: ribonuclease HII [Armatimonadota bacterium]